MTSPAPGHWIIFGSTSGIARAVALELGKRGAALVLAAQEEDDARIQARDLELRTGCRAHVVTRSRRWPS